MAFKTLDEIEAVEGEGGFKVDLGNDQWIALRKDGWTMDDEFAFRTSRNLEMMRMVVSWTINWQLKDIGGALVPFDQKELLAKLDAYAKTGKSDFPKFPLQLEKVLARAVWIVMGAVQELPL